MPGPVRTSRGARACASFLGCGASMLLVGVLSIAAGAPLLFPAIGASTFLAFFAPRSPLSAPRNILLCHALGAGIGTLAAALFGVAAHEPWLEGGDPLAAVLAASLALALTGAAMVALDLPHPPAGATTLIVATGILGGAVDMGAIVASALVLIVLAHLAHRVTGEPYPLWRAAPVPEPAPAIWVHAAPTAEPEQTPKLDAPVA